MKTLRLFIVLLLLGCSSSVVGIAAPPKAQALQGITGTDALMGAGCATNFTRRSPHMCAKSVMTVAVTGTMDNTCRVFDFSVLDLIPTSSQLAVVRVVGNSSFIYSNAGCTSQWTSYGAATVNETIPVPLLNGQMRYKGTVAMNVQLVIYYD